MAVRLRLRYCPEQIAQNEKEIPIYAEVSKTSACKEDRRKNEQDFSHHIFRSIMISLLESEILSELSILLRVTCKKV